MSDVGARVGLSSSEAAHRLQELGPNLVPRPRPPSPARLLLGQMVRFFALLLWGAAVLAWIADMAELAVAIAVVVIVNGVFAFLQEYRADKAGQKLVELMPALATVQRDGHRRQTPVRDIVVGDLLLFPRSEMGATRTGMETGGRLVAYVVLAFVFSWVLWVPMAVAGQVSRAGQGWPTHLVGLTGPALAAIVMVGVTEGRPGLGDLWRRATAWRVRARWWILVGATASLSGVAFLTGWFSGDPVAWRDLALYSGAPSGEGLALVLVLGYVLVVNGFGEELGW